MTLYPSTSFAKYTLTSHQPVLKSNSVSGKESSRKVNGHLHKFNISHPVMTAADFGIVDGFLCDKDYVSFTISLPDRDPQGVATGTPLVNSAHSKGDSTVKVDGCTPNTTDWLKAGDILAFAGDDTHVYTNLTDVNSAADESIQLESTGDLELEVSGDLEMESSNQAELSISPDLKADLSDNVALTVTSVPFTVRLDKPHDSSVAPPTLYNFNFNCTEVF